MSVLLLGECVSADRSRTPGPCRVSCLRQKAFSPHGLLSGKAKIYQGVRVKMTVKELLQQRRAKQATLAEAVSIPLFKSFHLFPYLDTAPEPSLSSCLQPWPFQNGTSCEEIPNYLEQLVDSCLQAEPPLEVPLALAQDSLPCTPENFQPALTCLGSGSPEAPDPSSSFDCSYSPSQMLPFAPLGYSCPALDGRSCMYPSSEERTCQSHNHVPHTAGLPTCYCTPCGSQHLETFRAPEYFPYATLDCKDYAPSVSAAEDFWKDRSWDLCYS
ncbi:PREDICTED: colorectal cancer-associated protein 2 [Thamnophis sirtalis]|uniref:Colorectal cancer-associated protein 2 n=1 Tax=Thamnophis sirtalis TaxID=35019 RepID=A0A6I9YER5_9SAUR|nr:PREDICTED: colorectal cancer-associated protein 2 [Thamnophis sirtalis]